MRLGQTLREIAATAQALDAQADILTFYPTVPIVVVRWGVIVSVLVDNTNTDGVYALDKSTHDSAGAATRTNRVGDTYIDEPETDRVIGSVVFCEPAVKIEARPGDFLSWQVETAAGAGDGFPFIEYVPLAWASAGTLDAMFNDDATTNRFDVSTAV